MRQPAISRSMALRHMASEYGSWPVDAAAHQMRIERDARRAASSAGMMTLRKCSNGTLSRKKNDSLVIIASTTAVISALSWPRRSACTRSPRPLRPALRATGNSLLSTRYCLSADSTRPERSFRQRRR